MGTKFRKIIIFLILLATITLPIFTSAETTEEMRAQIAAKQAEIQQLEKQIAEYNAELKNKKKPGKFPNQTNCQHAAPDKKTGG